MRTERFGHKNADPRPDGRRAGHQPTRNFLIAPKIDIIRLKFGVHPRNPGTIE
jgi:hypothetical protein